MHIVKIISFGPLVVLIWKLKVILFLRISTRNVNEGILMLPKYLK
jgi:hypothetical protein